MFSKQVTSQLSQLSISGRVIQTNSVHSCSSWQRIRAKFLAQFLVQHANFWRKPQKRSPPGCQDKHLVQALPPPGPALGVGRVGSRLGPQDLGGPQMPKTGPQLVAIKRSRYPNRTVTTLIEQSIIQSSRTMKSS